MLDPHREIQALVDNFVDELSELAKRIAIEQIKLAFVVGAKLPAGAPARPSAGPGTRLSAGPGTRPSAGSGARPSAGSGARPSAGSGARPSAGSGARPSAGSGARPSPGSGARPSAGSGARPSAGSGARLAPPAPDRASRARRDQREIEALRDKLLAAIAEHPGRRTEDLNAALGTKTAQIALLLRRLVADKQVRTEGARRGTRYFPGGAADGQNGRRTAVATAPAASVASPAPAAPAAPEPAAAAEESPA
jgi:hypothetical protein